MKINAMPQHTPMASPAASTEQKRPDSAMQESSAQVGADDVTQSTLRTALEALSGDAQEVDYDNVARMQALIAGGGYHVDNDELSGAMLDFYRNN